jgi:hypothetical protein
MPVLSQSAATEASFEVVVGLLERGLSSRWISVLMERHGQKVVAQSRFPQVGRRNLAQMALGFGPPPPPI